jgi:hypothetical protein
VPAASAGGKGVIEAPTIGRDLANLSTTGSMSWNPDRLPLSRFAKWKYDENGLVFAKPAIKLK